MVLGGHVGVLLVRDQQVLCTVGGHAVVAAFESGLGGEVGAVRLFEGAFGGHAC